MPGPIRVAEIADIHHSFSDAGICDRPQSLFDVDAYFGCKEYILLDPLFHTPCFSIKRRFEFRWLLKTGCCPNKNLFERFLKRFLFINFGKIKEVQFQLLEPLEAVLESREKSLRSI